MSFYYDTPTLTFSNEWNLYIEPVYYHGSSSYPKASKPLDVMGKFYSRLCELFEREVNKIERGEIPGVPFQYGNWQPEHEISEAERKQIESLREHIKRYYKILERHYSK